MSYLLVRATPEAFDEWKATFDDDHDRRVEYGCRGYHLFRSADDREEVVALLRFDDEEGARAWSGYATERERTVPSGAPGTETTRLDLVEQRSTNPPAA